MPHPEGGFFIESDRSAETISTGNLPSRYSGVRAFGTAIYYPLTPDGFSALHRVKSDEVFHHYLGDPVELVTLWPDGSVRSVVVGSDLVAGQVPQAVVPAGVWQGLRLYGAGRLDGRPGDEAADGPAGGASGRATTNDRFGYSLFGTTVAPGFEYDDFELGKRAELLAA